jgi:hypothetical protein
MDVTGLKIHTMFRTGTSNIVRNQQKKKEKKRSYTTTRVAAHHMDQVASLKI